MSKKRSLVALGMFLCGGVIFLLYPSVIRSDLLLIFSVGLVVLPYEEQGARYEYTSLDFFDLQQAVYERNISVPKALAVITKNRLFPFFLIVYLSYLFVSETHLFNGQYTRLFFSLDEQVLMRLVVVLGLVSLWGTNDHNVHFISQRFSLWFYTLTLCFSFLFAVAGVWIVRQDTISLGLMRHVLASSTGVIILLVSRSVLQYRE